MIQLPTNPYARFKFSKVPFPYTSLSKSFYPLRQELTIMLSPKDSTYNKLCSLTFRPIAHNCPQIACKAPSLEQYYQFFKVYGHDVETHGKVNWKKQGLQYSPGPKFFKQINVAFTSTQFGTYHKPLYGTTLSTETSLKGRVLLYWYYYNSKTKEFEKIPLQRAKRIYCLIYQQMIVNEPIYKILVDEYNKYDGTVLIHSDGFNKKFTKINDAEELARFYNSSSDFPDCYCLMEMLIHNQDLSQCIWNQETHETHEMQEEHEEQEE